MPSRDAADGSLSRSGREARQQRIRELVLEQGTARTEDLVEELNVSGMTVHRDLRELELQGWVRRVRGGVTTNPAALLDLRARTRDSAFVAEKEKIARKALGHVQRGQTVMIDESTTTLRLAQLLPERAPLTVISNFRPVINALAGEAGIQLIGLGGVYSEPNDAFMGYQTRRDIEGLRADVLFMSSTAVTEGSLYQQSPETVAVKQAFIASAARRVLLLDHSKFQKRALHEVAPLIQFDLIIVDDGIAPADLEMLRQLPVSFEVAG